VFGLTRTVQVFFANRWTMLAELAIRFSRVEVRTTSVFPILYLPRLFVVPELSHEYNMWIFCLI